MPAKIDAAEGRGLFGANPSGYDAARPEYPAWIYRRLTQIGALRPGCAALEIGAGTGLATRRLLQHGADPLTIIEPDPRFGPMLEALAHTSGADCRLLQHSFEAADLARAQFDLVVAATAFHWIDQTAGLRKAAHLLRRGGWIALWWNVFQKPGKPDAFHAATRALLSRLAVSPSGRPDELPFALDRRARESDLRAAGFTGVAYFDSRWTLHLDSAEIGPLYEGFSALQRLTDARRSQLLDALTKIAEVEFAGQVERNMTTCLYLARSKR